MSAMAPIRFVRSLSAELREVVACDFVCCFVRFSFRGNKFHRVHTFICSLLYTASGRALHLPPRRHQGRPPHPHKEQRFPPRDWLQSRTLSFVYSSFMLMGDTGGAAYSRRRRDSVQSPAVAAQNVHHGPQSEQQSLRFHVACRLCCASISVPRF